MASHGGGVSLAVLAGRCGRRESLLLRGERVEADREKEGDLLSPGKRKERERC